MRLARAVATAGLLATAAAQGDRGRPLMPVGYHAGLGIGAVAPAVRAGRDSIGARRRAVGWHAAGSRLGLLSIGGLPPVTGSLAVSGGSLVFRPAEGPAALAYPLYRTLTSDAKPQRQATVALLEVDRAGGDPVYLFHLDGAVLETASPGVLAELVTQPSRVDSLGPAWVTERYALVSAQDTAAQLDLLADLVATPYADSLFRLFGTPTRPLGLVGPRGQHAGRLGEFITSRDSVSLSPARMTSMDQLRHALAHELAHRWQRAAPDEMAALWRGVPPIRDSLRYGYQNDDEHQAEAVAFAVHFLQTTSAPDLPSDAALALLKAYERLVPGTAVMARRLVAQPVYHYHPLTRVLTASDSPVSASGSRSQP